MWKYFLNQRGITTGLINLNYRSIPEFQEYILIDQYQFYAAQYFKQEDEQWLFKDYEGAETIFKLASGNWEVSFQDLYARVDFDLDEE